eukprot:scaffold4884_cov50-Attheya_sp.AAC.4
MLTPLTRGDSQTILRTRSSRKKQKHAPSSSNPTKEKLSFHNEHVSFVIATSDQLGHENCLALIEGVGGGEEENTNTLDPILPKEDCTRPDREKDFDNLPHRGRILELPGPLQSGAWRTQVVFQGPASGHLKRRHLMSLNPQVQEGIIQDLQGIRIALRHKSVEHICDLNELKNSDETTISMVDPNHNRVISFINQGILFESELSTPTYDPFIQSITLALFAGFKSSSEARHNADDVSSEILSRIATNTETPGISPRTAKRLIPVPGKCPKSNSGVSLLCRLKFADSYWLIIAQDSSGYICGIDVVFRKEDCLLDSDATSSSRQSSSPNNTMLTEENLTSYHETIEQSKASKQGLKRT